MSSEKKKLWFEKEKKDLYKKSPQFEFPSINDSDVIRKNLKMNHNPVLEDDFLRCYLEKNSNRPDIDQKDSIDNDQTKKSKKAAVQSWKVMSALYPTDDSYTKNMEDFQEKMNLFITKEDNDDNLLEEVVGDNVKQSIKGIQYNDLINLPDARIKRGSPIDSKQERVSEFTNPMAILDIKPYNKTYINTSLTTEIDNKLKRKWLDKTNKEQSTFTPFADHLMTKKKKEISSESEDIRNIKKFFDDINANKYSFIKLLTEKSLATIETIKIYFEFLYASNLIKMVKDQLSGSAKLILLGLLYPIPQFDAYIIYNEEDKKLNEDRLMNVLCTRSSKDIGIIKEKYEEMWGHDLVSDIKEQSQPPIQSMLIALCMYERDTSTACDPVHAKHMALELIKPRRTRHPRPDLFIPVCCTTSYNQIKLIYKYIRRDRLYSKVWFLYDCFKLKFAKSIKIIFKYSDDKFRYFCREFKKAIKHKKIEDIIIIILRTEKDDLNKIFLEYHKRYGTIFQDDFKQVACEEDYLLVSCLNIF